MFRSKHKLLDKFEEKKGLYIYQKEGKRCTTEQSEHIPGI